MSYPMTKCEAPCNVVPQGRKGDKYGGEEALKAVGPSFKDKESAH